MSNDLRFGLSRLLTNIVTLVLSFVILIFIVQLSARLTVGLFPNVPELIAAVIGLGVAYRLRAREAAYVLWAVVAYALATSAMHFIFGVQTVQGREARFAVLIAGALGVLFGAWSGRTRRPGAVRVARDAVQRHEAVAPV
jgi:hypothetical protein